EFMGPAASGWIPVASTLKVASVMHGSALDNAGLRPGDVLEAVDGHPLNGTPDWFLARANFEIGRPVQLQVNRGNAHLQVQFLITTAFWQHTRHWFASAVIYLCRFIPLVVAIVIVFRRPRQASARLAAFMLAAAAVGEGYPSPGWMATVRRLPIVIAAPVCLATVSWLLAPVAWLAFFAIFPRPWLSRLWRMGLASVTLLVFVPPLLQSVIGILRDPWMLSAPWQQFLSHTPVRWVYDMAGVNPLFLFNHWPLFPPGQSGLLELWFAITAAYLAGGFVLLIAGYCQLHQPEQRRHVRPLLFAVIALAFITIHNFFVRNWPVWFGDVPPVLFSGAAYAIEALVFQAVSLTLGYVVLRKTDQLTVSTLSANVSGEL
ncbi:MAG TPA: PDZ domain-containing protein, partial [Candidatus Angelobacter sp.]